MPSGTDIEWLPVLGDKYLPFDTKSNPHKLQCENNMLRDNWM